MLPSHGCGTAVNGLMPFRRPSTLAVVSLPPPSASRNCSLLFRAIRVDEFVACPASFTVKVRELIRLLKADGWYLARTRGSHHQYKHPTKPGLVTVPGSGSDELAPATLNSILKQAGLKS